MAVVWALLSFSPLLLFSIVWMLLTTLPIMTLVPQLHNGGRLVYIVAVGWAMFLGAVAQALVRLGPTRKARLAIGVAVALTLAIPLTAIQQRSLADWRESFDQNRRLVAEMVEIADAQPLDGRFAILDWPRRFGVALSNRPDSAAKAVSTLAAIGPHRVDGLLSPDASTGTITFTVVQGGRLSVGCIERVERWQWSGDGLDQWQPQGEIQRSHIRSDGSRDYVCDGRDAALAGPDLAGRSGFYSAFVVYHPARLHWGFIMWKESDEDDPAAHIVTLSPLARRGEDARLANLGWLSQLRKVFFVPAVGQGTVTVRAIEIARFDIAPFTAIPKP
jgi:hypothetical protein